MPSPAEIEGDRLSVRRLKVGVNNITGRRDRRPLQILPKYRRGELCSPVIKQTLRTTISAARRTLLYTVWGGADRLSSTLFLMLVYKIFSGKNIVIFLY